MVDQNQNPHLCAPVHTAIEPSNDDDHKKATLGLAVDTQSSWAPAYQPLALGFNPENLVHHSLNISAPAVSRGMECLSQLETGDQMTQPNYMEGVIFQNGRPMLTPTSRLPSLAGAEVINPGKEDQSSGATDMVYNPPRSLSSAAGNDPMLPFAELMPSYGQVPKPPAKISPKIAMGYRADCDKCRSRVPGHYIHIRV